MCKLNIFKSMLRYYNDYFKWNNNYNTGDLVLLLNLVYEKTLSESSDK